MGLGLKGIKKITTRSGINIVKVRRRSDMSVLWSAEEYVYKDGVLMDNVTLVSIANEDNVLYADTGGQSYGESKKIYAGICGIDFTEYDSVDIVLSHYAFANYGTATIDYGIGRYAIDTSLNKGTSGVQETVITIDISEYGGLQNIYFYLYAKNNSSESTWGARSWIKISEIRLYNSGSGSGDNTEVSLMSFHDDVGNVTVKALTGSIRSVDDGEGNVTIFTSGPTDDIE